MLSITLEDESDHRVLAQACFNDFPNVHQVEPSRWEAWLSKYYESVKLSTFNTLFMHLFVAHAEFSMACAEEIVKSVFKVAPECHYIVLCVPSGVVPDMCLSSLFHEMKPNEKYPAAMKQHQKCKVLVANREKYMPILHIRDSK